MSEFQSSQTLSAGGERIGPIAPSESSFMAPEFYTALVVRVEDHAANLLLKSPGRSLHLPRLNPLQFGVRYRRGKEEGRKRRSK
jgi:hypothetical protein